MHASAPENAGLPGGVAPVAAPSARRAPSSLRSRAQSAAPAIGFVLVVVVFYLVEASLRPTPWVFTDELEWTQISRAIAATGHAARRGQPVFFKSLYAYLIAPAWWIHSTARAYSLIKDLNALVMCLAAVPAYLLARMLCPRRVAIAVAVLTISIPAMSYATSIIPEPLAYLWFTTTAWLTVRALAAPRRGAVALAVAAAGLGPLVQKEFVVLPAAGLLAAAGLWVLAGGARSSRPARLRRAGLALVGLALFGYLFNLLVVERLNRWVPSQYLNRHTLSAGGLAAGALAIGLGMGPVIGGIASLALPERRAEPAYRAFSAYLAAAVLTLWVYTAAKVTYLAGSTPLIEERNLFFLSPLLLCGSALVLAARRVDWRVVAAATALTLLTIWSAQLEVGAPYFEAPGLAILTLVNRSFGWTVQDVHLLLAAAAAAFVALLALRGRRSVSLLALVLAGAWLLTGEVYATVTDNDEARSFAAKLPPPRDWVDRASGGAPVAFLGESIADPNPIWLTEFWNRSLDRVGSITGDAPGPGPALAPTLTNPDGTLNEYSGDPFTLAGPGVVLQAPVVESVDNDTLYRTPRRWRLLQTEEGVYSDGWMSAYALVAYFAPGGPGRLRIDLSRSAYNGTGPAAQATIRVGPLRINQKGAPVLARTVAVRAARVPDGKEVTVEVPVAATPVAAIITIDLRTLVRIPGDPRLLGALVGFSFHRDRA